MWVRLMEYTKIKNINEYVSESVSPMNTPEQIFEMYSVPIYSTGHPEYLHGNEIASNKVKVRKNDVLLCKINPRINRVWIVADESAYPCIASSEWIVIRNSEYNPEFLAWYFRSPKFKQLMTSEVTGIGGSLTRAQPKAVAEYPVPVIERQEQDVITEILNKIYNIIDARRREIDILDELIKARFVEMFGDPGTPGQRYPTDKLGNVAFVKSSHRVFTTEFVEKGIPFFRGTEIGILAEGGIPKDPFYITEKKYKELAIDESKPLVGDLLMPSICNKGQVWMVDTEKPFYYKDGRILCISPNRDIFDSKYLQFYLKFRTEIEYPKLGSGSTFAEFKIFQLKELEVDLPPKYMQERFKNFIMQVDKSKVAVQKSLDETQLLFNSLMQKYFG